MTGSRAHESSAHGSTPEVGLTVTHRRYVPYSHAHCAGDLVDGAYGLGLFGDVATELCIRTDGDEGLFASYTDVRFLAPVRAGDCVEAEAGHFLWLRAFCPQACYAGRPGPLPYLLSHDTNRHAPLAPAVDDRP